MTPVRTIGAAWLAAVIALPLGTATAVAQTQCPPGQVAMPRKPPAGSFVAGKCVAQSAVAANQQLQNRDKKYCPNTLKYVPQNPAGRNCLYWDEAG